MPDTLQWLPLAGAVSAHRTTVDTRQWCEVARAVRQNGGRLLSLWGSDRRDVGMGFCVQASYLESDGLRLVDLPLTGDRPLFPDLSTEFPAAARMQRAVADLLGARALGSDARPWLRHTAWTADDFPLRRDFGNTAPGGDGDEYPFVRVEGDGVHEIAVGPVHAGIIEPGHFRFSLVGEKVLRLEERLGYTHKGIEKRFEQLAVGDGHRLAARICGDSAVAYAWAWCMALEGLCGNTPPTRAVQLRALLAERERLANHFGDLGALGNDAGFALGQAQFSRLKEDLLRVNQRVWRARYPFDEVLPGGVATDPTAVALGELGEQTRRLAAALLRLRRLYDEHAGVQDRFLDTGCVSADLANRLGLCGLAGRASAQDVDLRRDLPVAPYGTLEVDVATRTRGDVAARAAVRFDEAFESLRLCERLIGGLEPGPVHRRCDPRAGTGVGLIEGWRGPVFVYLELTGTKGEGNLRVGRCHPQDPSWHNWPVLEHAVLGNIVADFPLINKSFNLAYSGHDL